MAVSHTFAGLAHEPLTATVTPAVSSAAQDTAERVCSCSVCHWGLHHMQQTPPQCARACSRYCNERAHPAQQIAASNCRPGSWGVQLWSVQREKNSTGGSTMYPPMPASRSLSPSAGGWCGKCCPPKPPPADGQLTRWKSKPGGTCSGCITGSNFDLKVLHTVAPAEASRTAGNLAWKRGQADGCNGGDSRT